MKPIPPPEIPGDTEFERFDNAVRKVLTVPRDEGDRDAERPKAQQKKPPKSKK